MLPGVRKLPAVIARGVSGFGFLFLVARFPGVLKTTFPDDGPGHF